MPDKISAFVEAVAGEIRWKRARPLLTEEIETHLMDQRDDYISEGMAPADAEDEAVRQMGDPVKLGADLDRIHRPRPQWGLLAFALVLALTGMLLRYFFGWNLLTDSRVKDVLAMFLGAGGLMLGYFLDISFLSRWAGAWMVGLVSLVGVWGVLGPQVYGRSWIAERFLVLFPVALALLMWSQRGKRWRGVFLILTGFGAAAAVSALVPSLFSILLLTLTGLVLGIFFTSRDWFGVGRWLGTVLTALLGVAVLALMVYGMWDRITLIFHPEQDPLGSGYWTYAIRQTLAESRWLGGADLSDSLYYDQAARHMTSFVPLTYMIWRLGWAPFLLLMAAFLAFFLWAFCKVARLRQNLGHGVALAILTTLLTQAAFNLCETMGYPFFGGVPFPLVVGNWYTMLELFLIGLMLSAFRNGALPETAAGAKPSPCPAASPGGTASW